MDIFDSKQNVDHVAISVDNSVIATNDYNLSVSSYVTPKDNREQVGIIKLNASITTTVKKINALRNSIDEIIKEIENV